MTSRVLEMFDRSATSRNELLERLLQSSDAANVDVVAETDIAVEEARTFLSEIAPNLAYVDSPHPFADSLFYCAINLALYKALAKRGVDVHAYGAAMLEDLAARAGSASDDASDADAAIGHFPERGDHPGEFDVEMVRPETGDDTFSIGYNVKSCAICYLFGQHDAMDLVPYMCASDDVISDAASQGLKRSGTIALGAHQCDFRYGGKDEAKRVADHYADRIKFVHS